MYCFCTFDEFCEFCTYLQQSSLGSLEKSFKKSILYWHDSKYYLALYDLSLSLKTLKSLHCFITEFATYVNDSELFERKLREYGKVILNKNAIDNCIKYFG